MMKRSPCSPTGQAKAAAAAAAGPALTKSASAKTSASALAGKLDRSLSLGQDKGNNVKGAAAAPNKDKENAKPGAAKLDKSPSKKPAEVKKKLGKGTKYSKREVMQLKEIFDQHDKDNSGTVSIHEMADVLREQLALGDKSTTGVFQAVDLNGDGHLSFREYLRLYYPYASEREFQTMVQWVEPEVVVEDPIEPTLDAAQLEEIRSIFQLYDADKSGTLSHKELMVALQRTGYDESEIAEVFDKADTDGDKMISTEEFIEVLRTNYI